MLYSESGLVNFSGSAAKWYLGSSISSTITSLNFGLALYIKFLQSVLKCLSFMSLPAASYLFTKLTVKDYTNVKMKQIVVSNWNENKLKTQDFCLIY